MINVIPYDILDFKDEKFTKQNHTILGSGSYATVYISFNLLKSMFCALKVHQNILEIEMHLIANEYVIQKKLSSKFNNLFLNLIDDVYIVQNDNNTYSTYAGMEKGITTLDKYLKRRCLGIEEFQCLYHEILDSILKMHSLHIAHRDIKPQNILYLSRQKWVLGDFGCASIYQYKKEVHKIAGTLSYLPKYIRNKIQQNQYFFQNIEMEMDLFQNDIYAFTLTMLQAYKKSSDIIDLQNMIDQSNWNIIQDDSLQYLFKIYQKPYSYMKQHILVNFQHVQINQEIIEQQQKLTEFHVLQTINSHSRIEKYIKIMNYNMEIQHFLSNISLNEIFKEHSKKGLFYTQSEIKLFEEFLLQRPLMQNEFQLVDENKLQHIFQINQRTKKWQFDNIIFYYKRKGNFSQQIQCFQEFLKFNEKYKIDVKLTQIDQLFFTGQEQKAFIIMQELEQISYQLTQAQSLILKIYQFIQNKNWLEQAQYLSSNINIQIFQMMNLQYLQQMLNFYNWVISQETLPCQFNEQVQQYDIDSIFQGQILNKYEIISIRFGIQGCPINQMINRLFARGADNYGIFQIFYKLISASLYDNNHQLIKQLHQQLITFIESNKQLNHFYWLILFNYSIYCYKQFNYVESLQYQLRALDQVQLDDNEKRVQINIQIYCSLLKQFKYQKALKLFPELLNNINQNSRGYLRGTLIERLLKGTSILYIHGNFVDLQYTSQLVTSIFQKENDIRILSLLYQFEWEVLFIFQNYEQLINQFNNKMICLSLNSTFNDIQLLTFIQNIKFILNRLSGQSTQAQNVYFNYQEKFTQDLIIYQDLYTSEQSDIWNIDREISKLSINGQKGIINTEKALKMMFQLKYFT